MSDLDQFGNFTNFRNLSNIGRPGGFATPINFGGSSLGTLGLDFLEEDDPAALFFARVNQLAGSPTQQRQLTNLLGDVQNRFRGLQGRQVLEGGLPTATFNQFLGGDFPEFGGLQEFFGRLSPTQRGQGISQFAPVTRVGRSR